MILRYVAKHQILLLILLTCINAQKWTVKAIGDCHKNEMEYGYLLPELKRLMSVDVIPGCEGGSGDHTAYLTRDGLVDISNLATNPLSSVSVGVKWDTTPDSDKIDLDLGCIMLSSDSGYLDYVSYQKLRTEDGSISHGGDTRGDRVGDIDDEQIHISLDQVPPEVSFLGFYLTSYNGNLLSDVDSCGARLLDTHSQRDLALIDCDDSNIKQHTAVLLCILIRVKSVWYFLNSSDCSFGTALPENVEHMEKYILESQAIQALLIVDLVPYVSHRINISHSNTVRVDISCSTEGIQGGDEFGASIVMFDRQGKFIDGVDARRVRSRRGPLVTYKDPSSSTMLAEFVVNLKDPLQDNVFVYFIVLNGRNDSSDLSKLGQIRMRIINGEKHEIENCRYNSTPSVSVNSIILSRVWKDPKNLKVFLLLC